jgi:hypothetical protein
MLVAVDGGLDTCRAIRRRPYLFVGDLDSTRRPPRGAPALIYPIEKDFSDFAGAHASSPSAALAIVVVAGLSAGRLDHEWANLLEVGSAAKRFAGLLAPSSRGSRGGHRARRARADDAAAASCRCSRRARRPRDAAADVVDADARALDAGLARAFERYRQARCARRSTRGWRSWSSRRRR